MDPFAATWSQSPFASKERRATIKEEVAPLANLASFPINLISGWRL